MIPLVTVILTVAASAASVAVGSEAVPRPAPTAFTEVHVIPLDGPELDGLQTVVVEGGRIVAIGPAESTPVPAGALVVAGQGSWLVPGLVDSHVHLDSATGARPDFGDAPLYLSSGVTTVINLHGGPEQLDWRRRIASGELLAPNLYTAGDLVNEPRVATPEDAVHEVQRQLDAGYDLIKLHEVLDPRTGRVLTTRGMQLPAYLRLVAAARDAGLPVVGHAPHAVGLEGLLQSGQALAHVDELARLYFVPLVDFDRGGWMRLGRWSLFLLVGITTLWTVVRLAQRRARPTGSSVVTWTATLGSAAAGGLGVVVWLLVVPPGLQYGKTWLLVLLTVIGVALLGATGLLVAETLKSWRERGASAWDRILGSAAALGALGLSLAAIHWIAFAWRGRPEEIERIARDLSAAGVAVQSTLLVQETLDGQREGFRREDVLGDPLFAALPGSVQQAWRGLAGAPDPWTLRLWRRLPGFDRDLVAALHRQGAEVLAGTDAMGTPFVLPGSSLHGELGLLREAGLSSEDVLRAATTAPARFLGRATEFGTIAVGRRADLLLVDGNPLEDLERLRRPRGVMVRGRWLSREELDRRVGVLRSGRAVEATTGDPAGPAAAASRVL